MNEGMLVKELVCFLDYWFADDAAVEWRFSITRAVIIAMCVVVSVLIMVANYANVYPALV
jgi:heme/copper-type cytochrome/quinol oxidase subunit 4